MNISRLVWLLYVACLSVTLVGCTSGGSDSADGGSDVPPAVSLNVSNLSASTNENGQLTYTFSVAADVPSFQLLVFPGANQIKLVSLRNGQNEISLTPLEHSWQTPKDFSAQLNVLNFPFPGASLSPGTYSATYQLVDGTATDTPLGFTSVDAKIVTKRDSNLSTGRVGVNVVLVGPLGGSQDLRDSLTEVMTNVQSTFSAASLTLDIAWFDVDGPDNLPDPRSNDPFYDQLSKSVRPNAINIVFGTDVFGLSDPDFRYSISSGDGGAAIPSVRSASAVSIFAVAGGDGKFNFDGDGGQQVHDDEVRLASEEVAQLIGHYLGLSHTVENDGNRTLSSDALTDTPSCVTLVECREEKEVRENLMFPFPVDILESNLDTYRRNDLTEQQKAVIQRSVLVD